MRLSQNAILAVLSVAAIAGGIVIAALSWPVHNAPSAGTVNRHGAVYPPPARAADTPTANGAVAEGTCDAVSFGQGSGTTAVPGSHVTLTASATGCSNPLYRFWIQEPGSRWSMVQDYSPAKAYSWTPPSKVGVYKFEVDVRDSSQNSAYDAIANTAFTVTGCTSAKLSISRPAPQRRGTTITLSASANCPGTAMYRFWVRSQGGPWRTVRDYSPRSTFVWTPAAAGTYELEVDVRDQRSSAAYEAVSNLAYRVT